MAEDRSLLVRLLNTPDIAKVVPQLRPEVLHRVIEHCGLEACAEIVALATPAQIERVLDVDLWRAPRAGRDELFDPGRFGEWLDVLMQAGEDVTIEKLSAIDSELVVAGFSRHASVFDMAAVMPYITIDGEEVGGRPIDRVDTAEIGGFLIESRGTAAWDTVAQVLGWLNAGRPEHFRRLMRACVTLSSGEREEDQSHALLDEREQDLFDLSSAREERRDRMGYVTPADARAFLQSTRGMKLDGPQPPADPLAVAYFRSLASMDAEVLPGEPDTDSEDDQGTPVSPPADAASVAAVMEVLVDAGVIAQPRALLTPGDGAESRLPRVREYLEANPSGADELAYLTNVVLAGAAIQRRPFTPQEAPDMVAATCNLGLECWPNDWAAANLIAAFQVGWRTLYEVCLFAAESVIDAVATLRHPDRDFQLTLNQLRRELIRHGRAGTPWMAHDAFEALLPIDAASWAGVRALIDETPTLHPAATDARHTLKTVDPTRFEFMRQKSDVQAAREFLASLPAALSG